MVSHVSSHHESPNPTLVACGESGIRSGEKSISHGKPYKMHFLAYFTLHGALVMLNTLRKLEDHENHVRWIYLATVLYMGIYTRIVALGEIPF